MLLAVTTLSFDIAGLELFWPLTVGARVEVASRAEASDGGALAARLAASGATVLQATPATWRLLVEAGWTNGAGVRMLCGGEALPRALADRLLAGGGALWNLYGPTETTIWSTVERVEAGPAPVLIGRPIGNTQVYVLDGAGAAGAGGRAGGVVYRGRGRGGGVSGAAGADGGAVRAGSVQRRGGGAAVSDGGRGAVAAGWPVAVSGAGRPSGEGAGLPDRAGGD